MIFIVLAGYQFPAHGHPERQQRRHLNPAAEAERMMDLPAPHRFHITSPPGRAPFGLINSVQVNVNSLGQNIVGDAANEPTIAVDPNNPNDISIGWRQFNDVTSNFRQGGYSYSTDGGKTWTFPGVLENNVFRSDPVLSVDPTGSFYYLSLLDTFYDTLWSSPDWGQTWAQVSPAEGGDKEWMTIDRTNSAGRGNMYQTWSIAGNNYNGAQFTRSTDGGHTWMAPINIPNQPFWGTLDVGPNGECYLCGTDQNANLWFVRSSNAKDSTQTPTFDLATQVNMGGQVEYGESENPGGLSGQVWIAADRSGGPANGNIYMLASLGVDSNDPADVMFVRSTDGGNTWSTPYRVNDDALGAGQFHWFGTLAVAPNGRLDAVWYDTRNDLTGSTSELYYAYSLDAGQTWSSNHQLSPPFDEHVGYPNQNKIGDYIGMISDNTGADVAYSATFNNEEDVYFARIPAVNVLPPDAYKLGRGIYESGGLTNLQYDDGSVLAVGKGPTLTNFEAPVQVQLAAHSSVLSPTSFALKLVASTNTPGLQQNVSLYDYRTSAYVPADSRSATTTNQTVTVTATGTLSDYVNQSTGEVRALVTYKQVGPTLIYFWQAKEDQVQWTIAP
ncbi:MAG: sialidase family protein [Fimbriimonadaceae bacterium]